MHVFEHHRYQGFYIVKKKTLEKDEKAYQILLNKVCPRGNRKKKKKKKKESKLN